VSAEPVAGQVVAGGRAVGDYANGLVDSCFTLLGLLVVDCYHGDAYSCDALYWIGPEGSDYEAYGATCGGRLDWQFGRCSEL